MVKPKALTVCVHREASGDEAPSAGTIIRLKLKNLFRMQMSFQVESSWSRLYQYLDTCEALPKVFTSSTCNVSIVIA